MVMAAHQGRDQGVSFKEGLKNPFNPMGGHTTIYEIKNAAAVLTLPAQPSFCVMVPVTMDPSVIMIGSLDVKERPSGVRNMRRPMCIHGKGILR